MIYLHRAASPTKMGLSASQQALTTRNISGWIISQSPFSCLATDRQSAAQNTLVTPFIANSSSARGDMVLNYFEDISRVPLSPSTSFPIGKNFMKLGLGVLNVSIRIWCLSRRANLFILIMLRRCLRNFATEKTNEGQVLQFLLNRPMRTDQQLTDIVSQLHSNKQLIGNAKNPVAKFMEDVQIYLINRKCSIFMLQISYKLQEMNLLQESLRFNLKQKVIKHISSGDTIKNEHIQKYLWFLHDEFPQQRNAFMDAAELHTLSLFSMHQYMNQLRTLPTWEPYIRISNMLQALGHVIPIRDDLPSQRIIENIQSPYLLHVPRLYTKQESISIKKKQRFVESVARTFLDKYLKNDEFKYNIYLMRMEGTCMDTRKQTYFDVSLWSEFREALILLKQVCEEEKWYDTNLEDQVAKIYWRLSETSLINLENAAVVLATLLSDDKFLFSHRSSIVSKIAQSLSVRSGQEWAFLGVETFISLFQSGNTMSNQDVSTEQFAKLVVNRITYKRVWSKSDIDTIRTHFTGLPDTGELEKFLKETEKFV